MYMIKIGGGGVVVGGYVNKIQLIRMKVMGNLKNGKAAGVDGFMTEISVWRRD